MSGAGGPADRGPGQETVPGRDQRASAKALSEQEAGTPAATNHGKNGGLTKVSRAIGAEAQALFGRGVLIRNVSAARDLAKALRVSIGPPPANDAFLAAMRAEL